MTIRSLPVAGLVCLAVLTALGAEKDDIPFRDMEKAVHKKINGHRAKKGLDRLKWDDRLAAQARAHSAAMARGKRGFGHAGFSRRVEATGLDFSSAAENVGQNQGFDDPADQAVEGWLHSPGHRKNIEGRFDLTGVGIARSRNGTFFFTQIFILAAREE